MSYALLDDNFHTNEAIIALSHPEFRLYICAITYCKQQRSGGELSERTLKGLCAMHGIRRKTVQTLIEKQLFERSKSGVHLRNWSRWQRDATAKKLAGKRGATARWGDQTDGKPHVPANGKPYGTMPMANSMANNGRTQTQTQTQTQDISLVTDVTSSLEPGARASDTDLVWDAWKASTTRHRSTFDTKRKALIRRQLKIYPVGDLIDAVRGWVHDPHLRGENDRQTVYNDIELLLRDAKHIERLRDLQRGELVSGIDPTAAGWAHQTRAFVSSTEQPKITEGI